MAKNFLKIQDFVLEPSDVQSIFKFDHNKCIGVDTNKYQNILCFEFQKKFLCTVNIKEFYFGKCFSVTLYCAAKNCDKKFKLKVKKVESIKPNVEIFFETQTNQINCNHNQQVIRHLNKDHRKKLGNDLKASSVDKIRNDAILNCNKNLLNEGHLQNIYGKDTLRKLRSEINAKNDKHSNSFIDLLLKCNEMDCIYGIECKFDKFCVNILTSGQIEALKVYKNIQNEAKNITRIYYDATGSICAKPVDSIKSLLHYVLLIPLKLNNNDKNKSLINIAEMISSSHTSHQQELFLRKFIFLARNIIKDPVIADEIVTDFSWASINALTNSFNNIHVKEYILKTHDVIINNDTKTLNSLTVIKLCSSHITKNIKKDVNSCFKSLKKQEILYICAIIGGMFNITNYGVLDSFLKNFLTFLMTKSKSSKLYLAAVDLFESYSNSIHDDVWSDKQLNGIDIEDSVTTSSFNEFQTIYRSSPFFQIYDEFIRNIENSKEIQDNKFYSPKFAAVFMKKYVAFLPFWTQILTEMRVSNAPRANNAFVESYFGHIKAELRKNGYPLGKIKISRYLQFLATKIDADNIKVQYKIPSNCKSYRKSKDENIRFNDLSNTLENWKGKASKDLNKSQKGVFFNKNHLKNLKQ